MRSLRTFLAAGITVLALALPASGAARTFTVTKTADTLDGHCNSDCSLREAVTAANTSAGGDAVKLGPKTYKLTRQGGGDDNVAGDLDVNQKLKITGAGASKTAIDGAWAANPDGLIDLGDGISLKVSGLTLKGGDTSALSQAAGINVGTGSILKIDHARLTHDNSNSDGAILNLGTVVASHVRFDHNSAPCCPAFYNAGPVTAKLTNVTFDHNTSADDTGAMYSSGDRATLRNVTFSDNHAGDIGGGALISSNGVLNLTNVTFDGNKTKGSGGALYIEGGTTNNLNNVTFTRNVADSDGDGGGDGGGLFNSSVDTVNLQNTIIAANTDMGGEAPDCGQNSGDAFTSLGHNSIGPGPDGCTFTLGPGDRVGVEATLGLAPLADNGGFTQTVALKKSSDAINFGSKKKPGSGGPACDKHDQRGVKRPQGKRCDIGAYERKP